MKKLALLLGIGAVLAGSGTSAAADAADVTAEVQKGIKAYNDRDLSYFESTLAPDAVYIADDGATFSGRERILGLFKRVFAMTPARSVTPVGDVAVGSKGDVAWARFKYTLSAGESARGIVGTTLMTKADGRWQVLQIQNTRDGHASPAGHGDH
jgi:uncharacterized protein (TIGR02246 family)